MRKFTLASATLAAAFTLSLSAQAGILFPVVPFPGSTSTTVTAINNNNIITGYYTDAGNTRHGFVGTLDGNYTSFEFTIGQTLPYGINDDGYITGFADIQTEDCPVYGCEYVRAPDGTVTPITKKGAPLDGIPQEITKKRKFVGDYWVTPDGENYYRYGYVGRNSEYRKDITLPFNASNIRPRGINKNNEVTGSYSDNDTHTQPGFLIKNGVAFSVSFPDQNTYFTILEGVNDHGRVVGAWETKDGAAGQAFFYNLGQQMFNLIDVPGSEYALARSINNSGLVTIAADNGSFIYCAFVSNCPNMAGAIHVADKWVPAGKTRWAICKNDCLKPSEHRAAVSKADAAKIREAIRRDPFLTADVKLHP